MVCVAHPQVYVMAEARLVQLYPKLDKMNEQQKAEAFEVLGRMKGKDLVGLHYQPILPYFADLQSSGAFRVVSDPYVTSDSGTGIVHQAPAFGEDDYRVCLANDIIQKGTNVPCPVDANGRFTEEVSDFVGRHVKEVGGRRPDPTERLPTP